MSVVGRVVEHRLHCGPNGNCINRVFGGLAKAKIQAQTARTNDRRNFILIDGADRNLRFAQPVFEKRPRSLKRPDDFCNSVDNVDADSGVNDAVDYVTEHWPISADWRPDLDDIKFDYSAVPLAIFRGETSVPPDRVQETLKGALIEVHFELHHYSIHGKGHDSFNATIEQVLILQPGKVCPPSQYKRKDPQAGPIQMNPTVRIQKENSTVLDAVAGPSNATSPSINSSSSHTGTSSSQVFSTEGENQGGAHDQDDNEMSNSNSDINVQGKGKGKEKEGSN
ncbi:hypothetical protein BJY52DRAFT_1227045 [Lactarius psammicola]|nr:hypothetical protein BJY52DRAFT_1227045 [Lactarius psammicola]